MEVQNDCGGTNRSKQRTPPDFIDSSNTMMTQQLSPIFKGLATDETLAGRASQLRARRRHGGQREGMQTKPRVGGRNGRLASPLGTLTLPREDVQMVLTSLILAALPFRPRR